MSTKYSVLSKLSALSPEYVSGEAIARELGISRMAVSKAVKSLIEEGCFIESRKHYGYRVVDNTGDVLNKDVLLSAFEGSGIDVYYIDTTGSTNRDAKALASSASLLPYCVTCSNQTEGRGRLGRSFDSPEGGVYFSLVMDGSKISNPDLITIASAVAVSEVMERLSGIETTIKWVNDIYIHGKKAVGILTEGIINMEEKRLDKVVIGCGINLKTRPSALSDEVKNIATSFFPDGRSTVTRARVIAECAKRIIEIQSEDFLTSYKRRCFTLEKNIFVVRGDKRIPAYAYDIDGSGHLLVRYENGEEDVLSSGEVSIRL